MNRYLELASTPKTTLLWFEDYPKLRRWIMDNQEDFAKAGGILHEVNLKVTFVNGNILQLGHSDVLRYLGCRFTHVFGTTDERFLALEEV